MKYLIWIVLIVVILLLMRMLSPVKRRGGDRGGRGDAAAGRAAGRTDDADGRPEAGRDGRELMLRCNVCGVHIPSSDAVFARGRVYCGAEHRDADAGQDRSTTDRS